MLIRPASLFRCMGLCVPVVCALLFAPSHAFAATNDAVELESYRLTMDKVNSLAKALSDIGAYTKAHPEIRSSLESKGDAEESLDAVAARLSSIPAIAAILSQDRLEPREFLLTELTFVQTVVAVANKPIDQGDTEYAAKVHLNPANLTFMRDHGAELRELQTRLGTAS